MATSSYIDLFFFFLLTLFAEILGTISGFGSSLFYVSFLQFLYSFKTVLALTALLHVFSNTAKLIIFHKTIEWKLVGWLGLSSIAFTIVGAYLTQTIDFRFLKLALGIFLICFSLLFYLRPDIKFKPSVKNSVLGGSIAGFLAGFIGTGGAVRGLAMASFNLEKNLFVGTSAAIDFGVDVSRAIIYINSDFMPKEMLWHIPLLVVAAFGGSYLGKRLLTKLSNDSFKKILLSMVFLTGLLLIVEQIRLVIQSTT